MLPIVPARTPSCTSTRSIELFPSAAMNRYRPSGVIDMWSIRPSTPLSGIVLTCVIRPSAAKQTPPNETIATETNMQLFRIMARKSQIIEISHAVGLGPQADLSGIFECLIVGGAQRFPIEEDFKVRPIGS